MHILTSIADDKYMCKYIINNRMAYSNLKLHKITNVKNNVYVTIRNINYLVIIGIREKNNRSNNVNMKTT